MRPTLLLTMVLPAVLLGAIGGCQQTQPRTNADLALADAYEHYRVTRCAVGDLHAADTTRQSRAAWLRWASAELPSVSPRRTNDDTPLTLGMFAQTDETSTTQPTPVKSAGNAAPPGYWRRNIWHQMGHEAKDFGSRGFWRGFKSSFWDVENAIVLTATMGASITFRETGVDDAIRRRTHGSRQLGNFDEPIQLLGNPATHFAGAGVLWLTSTLTRDVEQHELAKTLAEALAVDGVTVMLLKTAANTTAPNGDEMAWPSGHTSSAFTVAAVLNERYGPLVGVPSLALAGLVGYQRIDSRVHDFSDVVFGGMLGYIIGTSIARDEEARFPELFGMQVVPYMDPYTGATGLALTKQW